MRRAVRWGAIVAMTLAGVGAVRHARALARAQDAAQRAGAERLRLIEQLTTAVEEERRGLGLEIHDVLNAILVRIRLDAQGIVTLAGQAERSAALDAIVERARSVDACAQELYAAGRDIVRRLRPEVLDVLGLDRAVEAMVEEVARADTRCVFRVSAQGDWTQLDSAVAIAAYRVVQEALSNVVKHAHARTVQVELTLGEALDEPAQALRLRIDDDGVGFDAQSRPAGLGLVGMRERVIAQGGTFSVRSSPGSGTRVEACVKVDSTLARGVTASET